MDALIAFWGHGIAAVLFAALLIWRVIDPVRQPGHRLLLGAFAMTAAWAWLTAIEPSGGLARFAETFRNLFWIAMLYSLDAESEDRQRGLRLVYGAVAAVIGFQLVVTPIMLANPSVALLETSSLLRLTTAAGALVLVHNLYGQAAPASRTHIRYAMLGLAAMWFYDLNYYTVRYLRADTVSSLADWRGIAMALTAPLFALAAREEEGWRFRLSRAASFQSLSLFAICGYFLVMAMLASALGDTKVDWGSGILIAMLAAMTVGLMVFLPSARARSWLKVKLAKHLFEHRYDYRAEWLRFAATLGRAGLDAPPLGKRVIKAFADIVESPGGLLLVGDRTGAPEIAAEWNWPGDQPGAAQLAQTLPMWGAVEDSRRVIEFDGLRGGWGSEADRAIEVPAWILDDDNAWTAVPLAHNDRLIGIVLLATPDYRRPLDWEDFDLLRTAGRQAASALAEALSQEALANAQRFEEFNRRFAFILHDIKNLVSQLGLLSRNAERHADNPEFRADMVATLRSSVTKMNDLLARLAPHAQGRVKPSSAQPLGPIVAALAKRGPGREVRLDGKLDSWVEADSAALEQALGHLVQNGFDASPDNRPVTIRVIPRGAHIQIAVIDQGHGMDNEFIRHRLYQPFASTKDNGFGIGAFEARSLILAMGGSIEVDSRPGKGTTFTVTIPAAEPPAAHLRKSA